MDTKSSPRRPGPRKPGRQAVPAFGAHLRELYQAKGWTRVQFEERTGLSTGYTGKLLAGTTPPPSEERIREIAAVLDADPDDLLFRARMLPEAMERQLLDLGAETVRWMLERTDQLYVLTGRRADR